MDDVTLYAGDCARVMAEHITDGSIDLTVTSPPYDNLRAYNGYTFDFEAVSKQLWRVTKQGGVVVWVVADATVNGSETGNSFRQALRFMEMGFNLHDTMIYETDKPPMNDNRYQACFEYMFILSKGKVKTFNAIMETASTAGRKREAAITYRQMDGTLKPQYRRGLYPDKTIRRSIWYFSTGRIPDNERLLINSHTAYFPEALARDHIISWSNPGDVVLDPMMGSGTTGKMAVMWQRRFIGIDVSPEYVDMARKRIEKARAQSLLFPASSYS